ncbi:MAG TPA: sulfotransferase [Anaerolineaceae bacterium]|nr:sulfotransferase [Anaerolineaceae bacterium]
MYFDLGAFLRYNFKAFFKSRGKHYRLTPRRALVLLIWLLLYIPAQIINRLFFLLDEILFPGYRRQEVRRPVFIIGNPRSGTTFLHRLINEDGQRFTSFKVWEMIFAPSITQRKMIWGLLSLARLVGAPIQKMLQNLNKSIEKQTKAHTVRLDAAEEDDHILIHAWSSETLWALYPIKEEMLPYFYFDRDIPLRQQERVMKFYRSMVKRHLFAHGGNLTLLSKNPAQTPKIASLLRTFPDARFINLARNPLKSVPSMMSFMAAGWHLLCDPLEQYPHQQEFFDVMGFFYRYPLEYFEDKPGICLFLRYENMVQDPKAAIQSVYQFLDLPISPEFEAIVDRETEKAGRFRSEHQYSLEEMNLTEQQLLDAYADIFSFYEFAETQSELPEEGTFTRLKEWRITKKRYRNLQKKQLRKARRLQRRKIRLE